MDTESNINDARTPALESKLSPETDSTGSRPHVLSKILSAILTPLFWLFLIAMVLLIFVQILPAQTALKYIGFKPLVILTDSMTDELDKGDLIVIRRASVQDVQPGDIVTVLADINGDGENDLVTHFLASIERKNSTWELHTKSNITTSWDNWVLSDKDLVGKLWFSVPKLGEFAIVGGNPLFIGSSIALLSLVAALYLIVVEVRHSKRR